jgi:DNA-binding MarR family transcriptional regulator
VPLSGASETELAPSLANNVGYLLHRAFQHVQAVHAERGDSAAQPRELALVARLLATGPQAQHELARVLSVNRSVMVHVLDELERSGFVVRTRNPADRRSHLISATPAGAAALERAAPSMLAADRKVTERLSDPERARLYVLLGELLGDSLPEVSAPIAQTVTYRIARAHFRLAAQANRALEPLSLDAREYGLLTSVRDLGPCSQQEIANRLDVSGPVIVELVDALEARELIVRDRNPTDRRSYALRLSQAGEQLLARAGAAVEGFLGEIAGPLGAAGTRELAGLLRALIGAQPA